MRNSTGHVIKPELVVNPIACLTDQVLNSAVTYFHRIHRAVRYGISVATNATCGSPVPSGTECR
jgi:methylaspartate ammonia-lyase